jgi:hypothetical protein
VEEGTGNPRGMNVRILLGTILVLAMSATGCQPSRLEQCREAVASRMHSTQYACGERFGEGPNLSNDEISKQILVLEQAGFTPDEVEEWGAKQVWKRTCTKLVLECMAGIPLSTDLLLEY